MVIAMVRVVVPESKRAEVLQALRLLRGPTAARMGCDGFHVYRDDEHENALLLLQQWASEADLDRYIRSDLYSTILAVIETAIEPPDIRFDTIAATAGVELVTAVRRGRATR
jgi:quinol monooxygenase YgiN